MLPWSVKELMTFCLKRYSVGARAISLKPQPIQTIQLPCQNLTQISLDLGVYYYGFCGSC